MFFFLFGKHSLESDSIPPIPTLHFKRCEKKHRKKNEKTSSLPMRIWNSRVFNPGSWNMTPTGNKQHFIHWNIPQNYHRFQRSTLISPKPATWMNPSEVIHVPYLGSYICSVWFPLPFEQIPVSPWLDPSPSCQLPSASPRIASTFPLKKNRSNRKQRGPTLWRFCGSCRFLKKTRILCKL